MTILGVDPGIARTGIGVIRQESGHLQHVSHTVIETPKTAPDSARLLRLATAFHDILARVRPNEVAVEKLFFQSNAKTAMIVGQARGVLLLEIARMHLLMSEYTPLEVKRAVTSYGKADKRQMQRMVQMILHLPSVPYPDDAADALALAIAASASSALRKRL
ncbi:MAG: crossover junction endodeoxyribonuclease RuvC [Candidatus Kerfeldbacteria bacterium]|nr:crossover junction endodeoxyribonuclease RuvC [Candidatus Kerfeldbacteria bacterium]